MAMVFQWFGTTALLPNDANGAALEKLKQSLVVEWIGSAKQQQPEVVKSACISTTKCSGLSSMPHSSTARVRARWWHVGQNVDESGTDQGRISKDPRPITVRDYYIARVVTIDGRVDGGGCE